MKYSSSFVTIITQNKTKDTPLCNHVLYITCHISSILSISVYGDRQLKEYVKYIYIERGRKRELPCILAYWPNVKHII